MVCKWTEQEGVITFTLTSDITTGEACIKRLERKGFRVGDYAKRVLRSSDFKPINGLTTQIAVLKGRLFIDSNRITSGIRAKAREMNLLAPSAEVACLIRLCFSDEELEAMGLLYIVTMHNSIEASCGDRYLLAAHRLDSGRWFVACCDHLGSRWDRDFGFAFVPALTPGPLDL